MIGDTPSSEDQPTLSTTTLAALQEFYTEQDACKGKLQDMRAQKFEMEQGNMFTMEPFAEDWNASQFWYEDGTAKGLARQLLEGATNQCHIAVVSAPSVFIQIKNLLSGKDADRCPKVYLLEFDQRFEVFEEFVKYDFEHPTRLPAYLREKVNRIICDPPFLSEDCQTRGKFALIEASIS